MPTNALIPEQVEAIVARVLESRKDDRQTFTVGLSALVGSRGSVIGVLLAIASEPVRILVRGLGLFAAIAIVVVAVPVVGLVWAATAAFDRDRIAGDLRNLRVHVLPRIRQDADAQRPLRPARPVQLHRRRHQRRTRRGRSCAPGAGVIISRSGPRPCSR